jgi:hypothetical protein
MGTLKEFRDHKSNVENSQIMEMMKMSKQHHDPAYQDQEAMSSLLDKLDE